jgi:hypothetical protein
LIRKELGSLVDPSLSTLPLEVDCYIKAAKYLKSFESSQVLQENKDTSMAAIQNAVKVAFDLKRNAIQAIISDFDQKYLRLKIVQSSKRQQAASLVTGEVPAGFDADQLSMSAMSSAESTYSSGSRSIFSSGSDVSETSKKSRKRA